MTRIEIEVYADASQPDLGRVAVLLRGVAALARAPVLRLRPVDQGVLADDDGQWPDGDVLPTEVRSLDDGVELIIGPEIAECPALLPGTAVEIEFPELRLRGEVLWPSVSLAARPRRRSIIGKKVQAASRPVNSVGRGHAADRSEGRVPDRAAAPGWANKIGSPLQKIAGQTIAVQAVRPAAPVPGLAQTDHVRQNVVRPDSAQQDVAGAEPAAMVQPGRPLQQVRPVQRPMQTAPVRPDPVPEIPLRQPGETAEHDMRPSGAEAPGARKLASHLEGTADGHTQDAGRRTSRPNEAAAVAVPSGATWSSRARVFGLIVGAVLAIESLLLGVKGYLPMAAGADPTPGKISRTTVTAGAADLRLHDLLQASAVSPRGVTIKENNADKLLRLANASLHAKGSARDVEEGAYWLKRYIAASLGEEQLLRALTQLGSAYAEPANGRADFLRARQLWEFASTFGDPVAMCFLGALHEHGLGVVIERKAALAWYTRAKLAGGCPQIEDAIARVKQ